MKQPQFTLALLVLSVALAMGVACAGLTVRQQMAVACEAAATSLDTLTLAKHNGKISKPQLDDAIDVYERSVVPACHPVADSPSQAFKDAVADLAARAGGAP